MIRPTVYQRTNGKSKYGNVKTTIHGHTFDSKREAERYILLRQWEKDGKISNLRLQTRWDLHAVSKADGRPIKVAVYVSDFDYLNAAGPVIEDVKGVRTPLYRLKKRWLKAEYGLEIDEI